MQRKITQKEELIAWLNDAYAMEQTNLKILEGHIKDAEEFPEIQGRLRQHLAETRQHAERMRHCIEMIGGKLSRTKSALGGILGRFQGSSTSMFHDDIVKDALSESAAEHFEVACYKSLIAAAEQLGREDVVSACRENMQEDMAMADWVDEQVPGLTRRFMTTKLAAG
jgi:ferritin-like metal-binding protein YciE